MKGRSWMYGGVAVLVSAVLLWWSVRGTDWGRVAQLLLGAKWPLVALTLAIVGAALLLRSLRWRILLRAGAPVRAASAFWATAAGYFGNNFLPARAGELVRTEMIRVRTGLPRSYVLATVVSERVTDAAALVAITAAVVLALPNGPAWLSAAAKPFAAAGAAGVLGIALLPRFESFGKQTIGRLPLSAGQRARLSDVFEGVLRGLRSFHDGGRLARFLLLTAVIWTLDAASAVACARALGVMLPIPVAFLLIAGLGLGSALPSMPGYVGVYQFVAVGVLTPFGITRTTAIAFILCVQALTYVVITAFGATGLWLSRKPVREADARSRLSSPAGAVNS